MDEKQPVLKATAPGLLSGTAERFNKVENSSTVWRDCSWCAGLPLFFEPANQSFTLNKQTVSAEKRVVILILIRMNLHGWKLWCFGGVSDVEWSVNQSSTRNNAGWRKQVSTVGNYGNKVNDAVLPAENAVEAVSFLKDTASALQKQHKTIRIQQGLSVVVLSTVCTWHFSLSWAASVGWLNLSMVPLPSCMMAPVGNRRGKAWKSSTSPNDLLTSTSLFGINAAETTDLCITLWEWLAEVKCNVLHDGCKWQ